MIVPTEALNLAVMLAHERAKRARDKKRQAWLEVVKLLQGPLSDGKTKGKLAKTLGNLYAMAMDVVAEANKALASIKVELFVGEDLRTWYITFDGDLGSCMTGENGKRTQVLANNPTQVGVLVAKNGNEPISRALLWLDVECKDTPCMLLDRIYGGSEAGRFTLLSYALSLAQAEDKKLLVRKGNTPFPDGIVFYPEGEEVNPKDIRTTLQGTIDQIWPYMDTFKTVSFTNQGAILTPDSGDYTLMIAGGGEPQIALRCDSCGVLLTDENVEYVNGTPYCWDCARDHYVVCDECGETVHPDDIYHHRDGNYYCETCWQEVFVSCTGCGTPVRIDHAYPVDDESYCEDCFSRWYVYCVNCDEPVLKEDTHEIDDGFVCTHCLGG